MLQPFAGIMTLLAKVSEQRRNDLFEETYQRAF
jgi:hypothetical protein